MLTQPLTGPNVATAAGATSLSLASGAIPSYTRRITLAINGLSLSGSANILLQLGSTTIQTSGYVSFGSRMGPGSTGGLASTAGIILPIASNTETMNGEVILTKGTTGNVWTASGVLSSAAQGYLVSGSVTLAGVLNIMRLFTTNGTDTFAAGTVGAYFE
jgi:hypothetical protein